MARPPSSGGPGPRPPLGGNGSGSGRAGAPGNGTAGKKRSSPAGAGLGQRRGRCEPRDGSRRARAPLSRAAGALCSFPSATGNVVAFLLQASGKRSFLILLESSISPARGAAWPAPSCRVSQRIAQEQWEPGASRRCRGAQSGVSDLPAGCVMSNFMVPFVLPARCSGTAALVICWHFFAPETNHTAHSIRPPFASNTHFGSVATGVRHDARARTHG